MFSVYRLTAKSVVRSELGVEGGGNPVSTSSRCEQTIWEQQRSNWIFTPTGFALKMDAAYSFEPLVYTQSALWMLPSRNVTLQTVSLPLPMSRFLQATILYAVPPLVLLLASHPGVLPKYLQSLRYVVCAAAPLGGLDAERFLKRAPPNTEILQGNMQALLWKDMIWYDTIWYDTIR